MQWATAVATIALFLVITWTLTRSWPAMVDRVVPRAEGRNNILDGFRGLLAISVVLHHSIINTHIGADPHLQSVSGFNMFMGWGAVSFFFMASAYLFAGQLIRQHGNIDTVAFFSGRCRRIVPLYAFAVIACAVAVVWEADFVVADPASFARDLVKWGFFNFVYRPDLNGIEGSTLYLGIVWTLRYEWMLYAALPVIALACRRIGYTPVVYLGLALVIPVERMFALFLAGALVFRFSRSDFGRLEFLVPVAAVAGLGGAILALRGLDGFDSLYAALLLAPTFLLVVRGKSVLVRWLETRPMRYLGQISYSIYLLHCLPLALSLKHVDGLMRFARTDDLHLALCATALFVFVFAVATATYLLIERPFLHPGKAKEAREILTPNAQVP